MSTPHEPVFSAYLKVLQRGLVRIRGLAHEGGQGEQIAALADALHVIPEFLNDWEQVDPKLLYSYLESYDANWAKNTRFSLVEIFKDVVDSRDQLKVIRERRKERQDNSEA